MEIKKCTSCKTEIAIDAKKCPNCKTDLRNWFIKHWIISSFVAIFFISSIMQGFNDGMTQSKGKELNIPEYTIIETTKLINGNMFLEVLITSLSKNTPKADLESISKYLSDKHNVDQIEIYCSLDAQKANYSSSFSEQHPNAIEECYLGDYKF